MTVCLHEQVNWSPRGWNRRAFLRTVSASALAAGTLTFRESMTLQAAELKQQGKSMILLWMAGGPSQFETFDPKPQHANGGGTEAIDTSVSGIQISANYPRVARVMNECAIIRSLTNKEGNHQRATYQLHTGYIPSGSVKHPSLPASLSRELAASDRELPAFVSVGPTVGAGFLGVDFDPFVINQPGAMPDNTRLTSVTPRFDRRLDLMGQLDRNFAQRGGAQVVDNHGKIYEQAAALALSRDLKAFDLSEESAATREAYGSSEFGKGCLLARRLVERGVSCIEVRMNGWDTHADNFDRVAELSGQVDPATVALISDLKQRGLLDSTLVVWMGEFGRTPKVNARGGRDHFPRAFNALLAGGGIRGGQVVGRTTDDGEQVAERPVSVDDLFRTICQTMNVNPDTERMSPLGRPMRIVDKGESISELLG